MDSLPGTGREHKAIRPARSGYGDRRWHLTGPRHAEGSASDEHHRSTPGLQWTKEGRHPTRISAGRAPFDLARPKGFEPPTF